MDKSPRSPVSRELDPADGAPRDITALLDAIPGAWEAALEGLADAEAGRWILLEEWVRDG
ncbi:MAG: hypothetical protein U0869_02475 [Chloroflexota bacterium]